ncbi:MAG: metal-dependent transcriptional regulator [Bacteroidetes bacterium]|nr:metal-dependent transcriptional regulator [Bacteroidota bacterium]MBS1941319.1 metal-dependent transcriptional regulator [Bacteroidota bacterium]
MLTRSEEDHIKAVHALLGDGGSASTKDVAERLGTKASSVTVMLKKLAEKGLLAHEPYYGVKLTAKGRAAALKLVRKHRLWETFLVERMGFAWDEVHEVAEQLEHVRSEQLTDRLAAYLGDPAFDPHGDPIPDRHGRIPARDLRPLASAAEGDRVRIAAVKDGSDALLHLLGRKGISIGKLVEVKAKQAFDHSLELQDKEGRSIALSAQAAAHLWVESAAGRKTRNR